MPCWQSCLDAAFVELNWRTCQVEKVQIRQGHWVIVDLIGKGGHVRTIPTPHWAKEKLDRWTTAAKVNSGRVFRAIRKNEAVWGDGISENLVWHVVSRYCPNIGLEHIAPHDLRQVVPYQRRRTGADSIPPRPRLRADHRALSWLQTESDAPGE